LAVPWHKTTPAITQTSQLPLKLPNKRPLQNRRSGFRQKAGPFNFPKKCGGLPTRRYDESRILSGLNKSFCSLKQFAVKADGDYLLIRKHAVQTSHCRPSPEDIRQSIYFG
jgi:hypothetical protein